MIVPAIMFYIVAIAIKSLCWDLPNKKKFDPSAYKITKPSVMDYCVCSADARVVVMIIQYGACFGTELAMNNQLATHFRVYFQMPGGEASALAGCFGLMNLLPDKKKFDPAAYKITKPSIMDYCVCIWTNG